MREAKPTVSKIKAPVQNSIKKNLIKSKNIFIGLRIKVRAAYTSCKPNKGR